MIKITIPIEPVEQARPRAVRMRRGVRLYDPAKVRNYKSELALRARMRYPSKPLTGPLKVTLRFYRHLQAHSQKKNVPCGCQELTGRLLSLTRIITSSLP